MLKYIPSLLSKCKQNLKKKESDQPVPGPSNLLANNVLKKSSIYQKGKGPYRLPAVILVIWAEYLFSTLYFCVNEWGCYSINHIAYGYNANKTLHNDFGIYQVKKKKIFSL